MITVNQHKAAVTRRIIAKFSDDSAPKMGLSAFFTSDTTSDKQVSIEVERNRQLVAVDVQRGTDANHNTFNNYTEKLFVPPMYLEGFNFSDLDRHDVTFGNNNPPTASDAMSMISQANRKLNVLRNKIKRAIAVQQSQALQTGVVTLKNGDNIDFKRKAASLAVLAAADQWSAATSDPYATIQTGCEWIRNEGLSASNEVNVIMGRDAFREFMNNEKVKDGAEIRRITRTSLGMPKFEGTTGLTFHGQVAVYDFVVNIWTYSEFYETNLGVKTPYLDPKNVLVVARDFVGRQAYAGVPAIMRDKSNAEYPEFIKQVEAEFYINNYVDPRVKAHKFDIASAPLAIPVSIDRVYTAQVLA